MMDLVRPAFFGFGAGMIVPCFVLAFQYLSPERMANIMQMPRAGGIFLALWPSSLFLMGTDAESGVFIPVVSVLLNGLLYALVFFLFHLLLKKVM
jgi:hypothetical protein